MKAVEEAEASGSTGDRGAWKWKIRQRLGTIRPELTGNEQSRLISFMSYEHEL